MGILFSTLHLLAPVLRRFSLSTSRVLTLGNQDLYYTYDELCQFLTANDIAFAEVATGQRRLTESHATVAHEDWYKVRNFIHQQTLFQMLGFDPALVRSIDVDDYEHADILHDLSEPLPPQLVGAFDIVMDLGTIEHLADVRRTFANLTELVAIGGRVIHACPANFLDHGFFNICPTLLRDVYLANGFEQEQLCYVAIPLDEKKSHYYIIAPGELSETDQIPGHMLTVWGIFRKVASVPFRVPKQSLYVGLHEAWDHQTREQSRHEPPATFRRARRSRKHWRWPFIRARSLPGKAVYYKRSYISTSR